MVNPSWWSGIADGLLFSNTGEVFCAFCKEAQKWCSHLQNSMLDYSDSKLIWGLFPETESPNEIEIEIPVFPSFDFWEKVSLVRNTTGSNPVKEIFWTEITSQDHTFLGFLNPGEGRQVIRLLLIQQLWINFDIVNSACLSSTHGPQEQVRWYKQTSPNSNLRPIQFWSVYRTGLCLLCLKKLNSISDLVPDKEGSVWNR
jgi:hypothetical protein